MRIIYCPKGHRVEISADPPFGSGDNYVVWDRDTLDQPCGACWNLIGQIRIKSMKRTGES